MRLERRAWSSKQCVFMCGREREGGREERLLLQEVFHTDERRKRRELHLCVKKPRAMPWWSGNEVASLWISERLS